ncbi:MAG: hypothetical protein U1F27_10430 [Turneriella sp.]
MKHPLLAALVLCSALFPLFAADHPAEQITLNLPAEVSLSAGRSAEFEITASIPKNHHIYLKHANRNGRAVLTNFSVPADTGFQIKEKKQPVGVKVDNEFVLRSTGKFVFELSELAMNEMGKTLTLPLSMRVQICEEGQVGICYMPITIEKKLKVVIAGPEFLTRDLPDGTLPWINNHSTALEAAKLKNLNIFALISDPARCGACAYLESKIFTDPAVNKMLQKRFVLYRVPRNEYSHAPISGSFGIPFYFIISPDGKNVQKWMGAPAAQAFVQRLEPYAKDSAPAAPAAIANAIPLNSGGKRCVIPLKQSYAFQATQKGDFKSSGNMRFVLNASSPGAYTVLTLDRTGEIDSSNSARVSNGALVVEKFLGGSDLVFQCSSFGIAGQVAAQAVEIQIELR